MSEPLPSSHLRALPENPGGTKERLLDAAERLFAERGFEGTSIRAVTQAAGASVSAANYHFGSKEALLQATLQRRLGPVNRQRLARLSALEAGPEPPSVEAVLEAFLRPGFEARAADAESPLRLRQVAARLFADPPDVVASLQQDLFGEINERFVGALARALPGRPVEDVALGFRLTVGMMVHVIAGHLRDATGLPDEEAVLRRMIAFAAAGLRAAPLESPFPAAPAGADT